MDGPAGERPFPRQRMMPFNSIANDFSAANFSASSARAVAHPAHVSPSHLVHKSSQDAQSPATQSSQAQVHAASLRSRPFSVASMLRRRAGSLPRRRFSDCSKNRGLPAKCGLLAAGKWQILKEKNYVAGEEGLELSVELSPAG
jgi:hypothetical protein